MNQASAAASAAVVFVWLGMILAISFLEAPLKFRAPGVTMPIGLGIGRLVFRALNRAELLPAVVALVAITVGWPPASVVILFAAVVVILAGQLIAVRPRLNRRSDRVLAGESPARSTAHLYYVALETAKVFALTALGIVLLTT